MVEYAEHLLGQLALWNTMEVIERRLIYLSLSAGSGTQG
jgi:hypothetical protein